MKKFFSVLFAATVILAIVTSCKTDDPIVNEEGTLISATYHATYKTFTLTYSNGETKTVNAIINETTVPHSASATLEDGTTIYVTDSSKTGKAVIGEIPDNDINIVSQFVYDGMSLFYLWNNEIINKKPTASDSDPERYFYSILNSTDTQHGWSWITDDINSLMSGFQGEATDAFGFQPYPLYYEENSDQVIGFVRYVFPNTPADKAGIKRGEVITHANGSLITDKNYSIMYGANSTTKFTVLDQNFENPREVSITPASINTDPVLFHDVYEINGSKIGYLFYTNFTANYNESLHRVFSEFKSEGITDLVLDLRYNPGGGVSAATYLASLIAPIEAVQKKEVFSIMSYNDFVNKAYDDNDWDRSDYLGDYDNKKYPNPVNANINNGSLNLYVITTRSSASASELLTFCLQPFMNVNQIGEKTSGKYTASWTIHPYNNFGGSVQSVYREDSFSDSEKRRLENWAMQPIVGRYTDKDNKDFIATNGLIPNYPVAEADPYERNTSKWKPIGDEEDYLFAKAISLITGRPYTATSAQTRSANVPQLRNAELYSTMESVYREGVIIDNPKMLPPLSK